jgi:hypothetical protein
MIQYFKKQNNLASQEVIDTFIAHSVLIHSETPYEYPDNFIEERTEYFNSKLGKQLYYFCKREGNETSILSIWEDEIEDNFIGFEFVKYMSINGKIPVFQVN